ncbi:MAG: hypothetical protein SPL15_02190 [Lachnospiraceae bacterium]|nr:hypothetical protein [Lachnospiraceae bacterium]MDY5741799.1 hypothetical protein [Lachnospiraceae bacterium]
MIENSGWWKPNHSPVSKITPEQRTEPGDRSKGAGLPPLTGNRMTVCVTGGNETSS